jgi:hypothetical protein
VVGDEVERLGGARRDLTVVDVRGQLRGVEVDGVAHPRGVGVAYVDVHRVSLGDRITGAGTEPLKVEAG